MLWHLDIRPGAGTPDREGRRLASEAEQLGIEGPWRIKASRGFLLEGGLDEAAMRRAAETVLVDSIVEAFTVRPCGQGQGEGLFVHVLRKPGVTDPEAESAQAVLADLGFAVRHARSVRSYEVEGPRDALPRLIAKVLANEAVEQSVVGAITFDHLGQGRPYQLRRLSVPIRGMDQNALLRTSREGQLSLSLEEMKAIQGHFETLGRDPTDCELETIAQTWSEHCSHKTLKGRIELDGTVIDNLLKQTIFKATQELKLDWLVSVFSDNAGVVRFDDEHDVCFKVETHNHPSAIDPYGGSNTGLGGVIRDVLGTGLAARPIANTDVFCVAPPETDPANLPPGVIHPRQVLEGVVAGVRDYGNRMGIPTVNGAVVAHPAYLANPLVFCGTIGALPRGMAEKSVMPGDRIIALGGRTGRDGIHGATFSSIELSAESEDVSGGAVQIGNAITEKMVADVVLQARDRGLFRSITDCGAGGFSSAVGEMAADCGAEVDLDKAPLKYEGLSYTEIWISEAQERMVLAVPPEHWPELKALCGSENVEATDLGRFTDTRRLVLRYQGQVVGDLDMDFLHDGRPKVVRPARRADHATAPLELPPNGTDLSPDLIAALRHWDVASKEWIVRQYDHEVQARTVVKPLVGEQEDGPGDAAVIQPVRGSLRGLAVACGLTHRLGERDPYQMALGAVDEAVRNCVAVGASPDRIALLDNFCWGSPERPEALAALVDAARGCHDAALAYRTPFISGKDSLYNEYVHEGQSHAIPPTLLISAIGQVPDVRRCVTMDLKRPGNALVLVGTTGAALGGSIWAAVQGVQGGDAPVVNLDLARAIFDGVHQCINEGLVLSCHDLSDGGLAVALAEMAFAGGLSAQAALAAIVHRAGRVVSDVELLFAESPSRFLLEARPDHLPEIERVFRKCSDWPAVGPPLSHIGEVVGGGLEPRLVVLGELGRPVIDRSIAELKAAWQRSPRI